MVCDLLQYSQLKSNEALEWEVSKIPDAGSGGAEPRYIISRAYTWVAKSQLLEQVTTEDESDYGEANEDEMPSNVHKPEV